MIVPINELAPRDPKSITHFVIHHSVASPSLDIEQIAAIDINSQGFVTVGYNAYMKIVNDKPILQFGRPINTLPAAQYGMNTQGYALCIGGNYQPNVPHVPTNTLSDELWAKIEPVILQLITQVKSKAPNLKHLIGHRDVATIMVQNNPHANPEEYSTLCPGDILYAKLDELRVKSGLTKGF